MNLGSALSRKIKFVFILGMLILSVAWIALANPDPIAVKSSDITVVSSSHMPTGSPGTVNVIAGNITELSINGTSVTQSWAGVVGLISGTIVLDDAADKRLYKWSDANPTGQIYLTRNTSVKWTSTNIACWNGVAATVDTAYNISSTDADTLGKTFTAVSHPAFSVGANSIGANACSYAVHLNNVTGKPSTQYTEVLLAGTGIPTTQPVFASLLKMNATGFGYDAGNYNFESIVLEDGHNGDRATTAYYLYVELK